LHWKVVEEIRIFLEWVAGTWYGVHQTTVCGFGSRGFDIAASFFMDFQAASLGAAVDFVSGFSGLAEFLVAVTFSAWSPP
jgi:hypothetical protein